MAATAEPIEVVWCAVALIALAVSVPLCLRAFVTAMSAEQSPETSILLRRLAWMRLRNECKRALVALLVLVAGLFAVLAPAPLGPSPARPHTQVIWIMLAVITGITSIWNEVDTRWVDTYLRKEERI